MTKESDEMKCKWCTDGNCELRGGIADDESCNGSYEEMCECSYVEYREPVLCGFVWCHGRKDFSVCEVDIKPEDRAAIEQILIRYDTCGTSERNVWDRKFSDVFNEDY